MDDQGTHHMVVQLGQGLNQLKLVLKCLCLKKGKYKLSDWCISTFPFLAFESDQIQPMTLNLLGWISTEIGRAGWVS